MAPSGRFSFEAEMRDVPASMEFLTQFVIRALMKANLTTRYRDITCLVFPFLTDVDVPMTGERLSAAIYSFVTGNADFAGHIERDLSLFLHVPQFQQWEEEKRISRKIVGWEISYDLPFETEPYPCRILFDRHLHRVSMDKLIDARLIRCHRNMTTSEALIAFYKLMRGNRGLVEVQVDSWHPGFANLLKRTVDTRSLSLAPMRVSANNPDDWNYLLKE